MAHRSLPHRLVADEDGATAVEYGFLASLIALAIVAGAAFLGDAVKAFLELVGGML
ncbi:MAG TPA: Flp family type IVb pilin [Acidimicrobiia bacterium]|nr:Flp family type IVb pilin [Acidimicrobiia bacterium]